MELWISASLFVICAAGFILAAKLLKHRPPVRRVVMLACLILGAMMLLYSCLTGFLLAISQPSPEETEPSSGYSEAPLLSPNTLYLSLDGIDVENGTFYLSFTSLDEYLSVIASDRLPLSENLVSSMLPGWDENGKRYEFFTAKDFSLYWTYCEEQGFSAIGSLCRFRLKDGMITELNEIDPTPRQIAD